MRNQIDLSGRKFGKLTVLKLSDGDTKHGIPWICQCDCGNECFVTVKKLRSGNTVSCGCKRSENWIKNPNKQEHPKLYSIWAVMRLRCKHAENPKYKYWAGKGIKVCNEWNTFDAFCEWAFANGYKEGLTIDRIDNDQGYCPKNCRWVTSSENSKNVRKRGERNG